MPSVRCPQCATVVTYADGFQPICPGCGFAGTVRGSVPAVPPAQPAVALAPVASSPSGTPAATGAKAPPSQGIAIAALLLNLLVWPGLGTMVGGRIGEGLAQGLLFLLGTVMLFTLFWLIFPIFVGGLLMFGMWVWGLVSAIQILNEANAAPRPVAA